MNLSADDILRLRLGGQHIGPAEGASRAPADVVAQLCAMQAQDYLGSLWAVSLRCAAETTAADVERAIEERRIVRTWPMRGTLHLVSSADVRWMLGLLTERPIARAAKRHADLGLTSLILERAHGLFVDALSGGRRLTRSGAMELLEAAGIPTDGQRGYHVLWYLAQTGVLCCGPMQGKQQSFVLLDEWVPTVGAEQDSPPRDASLARLAQRYFAAHGPATLDDFAWWAGITKTDARLGVSGVSEGLLARTESDGTEYWLSPDAAEKVADASARPAGGIHLLPGFDEYIIGYSDRGLQLGEHCRTFAASVAANGMFSPTIVIGGHIKGVWKRKLKRDRVDLVVRPFRSLSAAEEHGIHAAAARYARHLGVARADVEVA